MKIDCSRQTWTARTDERRLALLGLLSEPIIYSLVERRQQICLKFAKQCLRNEKLKDMFPRTQSDHKMDKRYKEKYVVKKAMTERFKRSAIPSMQRLLNNEEREKAKIFSKIKNTVPVNYGSLYASSLRK